MSAHGEVKELVGQLERGGISRREFVSRALALGLSFGSTGLLLDACKGRESTGADRHAADLGPIERELHIYNWSDYIDEDTIPNFEKEFGVRVTYDTYESNEEMLARLRAGASGYDIIVPSGYIVPLLVATDMLAPLSRKYLTNDGNVSAVFRGLPSDPHDEYTVPWQWGTTGIAYRTDKIKIPVTSWDVFHEQKYAGKLAMMDDSREVIGAELRRRGHSLNSANPTELAQARADSIDAKKNLRAYSSAPVKAQLICGDVWISQLWNGEARQAASEQPSLVYVIPREGCAIWADSMTILKSSPNKRAAHEWINYLLRPEVGAVLSEATGYGTPNEAAAKLMEDPVPYPAGVDLERMEYQVDLGRDTATWDRIWTEIRSA